MNEGNWQKELIRDKVKMSLSVLPEDFNDDDMTKYIEQLRCRIDKNYSIQYLEPEET